MVRRSMLTIGFVTIGLILLMVYSIEAYMIPQDPFAQDVESRTFDAMLSGSYTGTVAINEPLALGILDLSISLTENGDSLSGVLSNNGTLAYPDSSALQGSITGATQGITPTFTLRSSAPIDSVVSGRPVERTLMLTGEILEGGDVLRGAYTEEITGFTPEALLVQGSFLLSRGRRAASIVLTPITPSPGTPSTPTGPGTSTPTATAVAPVPTSTPVPGVTPNPDNETVYLPIVVQFENASRATDRQRASVAETPSPTASPTLASSTERSVMELTPRPGSDAIYLPIIVQMEDATQATDQQKTSSFKTPTPVTDNDHFYPESTRTPTSVADDLGELPNKIYLPDVK